MHSYVHCSIIYNSQCSLLFHLLLFKWTLLEMRNLRKVTNMKKERKKKERWKETREEENMGSTFSSV